MNIEGIKIETRPIFTEHNIFEANIFNPYNVLDNISSTSTCSPKIPFLIPQPMKLIARSDIIIKAPTTINAAHCVFKIT